MQVALFVTCLVDQFAPAAGRAAVELLEAAGCEVVFPGAQTCCGQPAFNAGFPEDARRLARHFLTVFEPYDAIVAPSGSCAAMVHHYYPTLFDGDERLTANAIAAKTYELTQFLVDILDRADLPAANPDAHTTEARPSVTYHASCHLLRELGVKDAPRKLLAAAGVPVSDMAEPERCCGFGGTFSIEHPEMAVPMADVKLDQALATKASVIVACDSGCLMHLATRAEARGLSITTRHVAEVVAEALSS